MGSSGGASEIVESGEEFNYGIYSNRPRPIRVKLREDEGKSSACPVEDDLNRLIETIDLRSSPRILRPWQMDHDIQRRDISKKPIIVNAPQDLVFGISDSVTLKQALRRLCISQASEQAAMKRLTKPIGSPGISEADTIKRLFATLILDGSKPDLSVDEVEDKLSEVSITPKSIAPNSPKKGLSSRLTATIAPNAAKTRIQDGIDPPKIAAPLHNSTSTSNAFKTRIQDVIATPSAKGRGHSVLASELGIKRKSNLKTSTSSSETKTGMNKPCMSPAIKPTFRNNLFLSKKVRNESTSSMGDRKSVV